MRTLVQLRPPEALNPALAALTDPRPDVREKALQVLGAIGDESVVKTLVGMAGSSAPDLRRAAAEALGKIGGDQATLALLPLLRDPDPAVRRSAVRAFSGVRDPRIYQPLIDLLRDGDEELRALATETLSWIGDARILELLLQEAGNIPGPVPVLMAVIRRLNDPAGTAQLLESLRYDHRLVRIAAAEALRRHPGPGVVDALVAALESPDERLRGTIVESLAAIGDRRRAAGDPERTPGERADASPRHRRPRKARDPRGDPGVDRRAGGSCDSASVRGEPGPRGSHLQELRPGAEPLAGVVGTTASRLPPRHLPLAGR